MKLEPLPLRTRAHRGEDIDSYSRRHAIRNFSTAAHIESALRRHSLLSGYSRVDSDRLAAWRKLGELHEKAFTAPEMVHGNTVETRALCARCARGERAMGRIPELGMVCVRHRRWLGSPQIDLHGYPPAIVAERRYRAHLGLNGVTNESFAMRCAQGCASPGIVGWAEVRRRQAETGIQDESALLYPEQIKFARLITRRSFLAVTSDPDVDPDARQALVAREVAAIIPETESSEPWRAQQRILDVLHQLAAIRRKARYIGTPPDDPDYNLLRHLATTPEPSPDDQTEAAVGPGLSNGFEPEADQQGSARPEVREAAQEQLQFVFGEDTLTSIPRGMLTTVDAPSRTPTRRRS